MSIKTDHPARAHMRYTTRDLRCKLTDIELRERGQQMARRQGDLYEMQLEHRRRRREMKEAEDDLQRELRELGHDVRTGTKLRAVDCEWQADFAAGEKHLIRLDTEDVVETVPLSDAERQRAMDL